MLLESRFPSVSTSERMLCYLHAARIARGTPVFATVGHHAVQKPKRSSTISGSSHIPPGAPYNLVQCISRIAPTAGRAPLSTPTRNFWVVGADSPSRIHVRLTSLEELLIWDCPGIKSLPEGIKGLTSLRKLVVWDCPDLHRRCKRRKGEDWHLISHIPALILS